MATQFAEPVSDETELELCKSAVPENTKSTMQWEFVHGNKGIFLHNNPNWITNLRSDLRQTAEVNALIIPTIEETEVQQAELNTQMSIRSEDNQLIHEREVTSEDSRTICG